MFDNILDNDEVVVDILRPSKAKLIIRTVLLAVFWIILLLICFVPYFITSSIIEEATIDGFIGVILAIVFLVIIFFQIFFTMMWYNKTYYAYTNKRLIIRTGIIGVDFRSLDIKMVGATDVYVSLLDKIANKNTGSLRFGSMSSPIVNSASMFSFSHISDPYNNYKKIKEHIELCKQTNTNA